MIKPEWGTKRTCPKCATRFYDLEKDDPVTCINCGYAWEPEPVLKSKVKTWLVQKDEVMAFAQARAADGGHGALLVLLRSSEPAATAANQAHTRMLKMIRPSPE